MTVLYWVLGLLVYFGIGCAVATILLWLSVKFGDGELPALSDVTVFFWPAVIPALALCGFLTLLEAMFKKIAKMMKDEEDK